MTDQQRVILLEAIVTLQNIRREQGGMNHEARFHEAIEGIRLILEEDMRRFLLAQR